MKRYACLFLGCLLSSCGTAPTNIEDIAASDASDLGALDAAESPLAASVGCDLAGPWLFELSIPVRWDANAQIESGSGRVRVRATSNRKAAGNLLIDGLTPCAMVLPATTRKSGARLRTRFAKRAFAEGAHTITPGITSVRGNEPGARFRMQPLALQYGAVMANPTMAPWPDDIEGNAVDVDNDGHPGVTIAVSTREQALARDPVTHLYVAWRVVLRTAGGKIDSCERFVGLGVVPNLGDALAVNVSVMGCSKRSGTECTKAEAAMAAAWLPTYLKDGNAAVEITRMAADTPGVCKPF